MLSLPFVERINKQAEEAATGVARVRAVATDINGRQN